MKNKIILFATIGLLLSSCSGAAQSTPIPSSSPTPEIAIEEDPPAPTPPGTIPELIRPLA
jgi:hypothetical protein